MKAKRLNLITPVLFVLAAFLFEMLLSNYTWLSFVAGSSDVKDFRTKFSDSAVLSGDEVTQVLLGNLDFEVNSVSFKIAALENTQFNAVAKVLVDDDSTSEGYHLLTSENIAVTSHSKTNTLYLRSAGNADSVILLFENYDERFIVTDFTVNPSYAFSFNATRFLLVIVIAMGIYLYKNRTDDKKISLHLKTRRAVAIALCICIAATFFVAALNTTGSDNQPVSYPLKNPVEYYNPYIQQFDAFQKGQLHFDVEPTEELLALENPYNPADREGVYYLWDRAFYEGKYYSYFGVTPILTLYYPVYLLTGSLPGDNAVITVYAFMTVIFFALAVMQWYKNSGKKNSPYFAAVCSIFAYLSSFALIIFRGTSRFYYIASMAVMAFISAFIYFMLKALGKNRDKKRVAYFVIAGICFGFAFHARVNTVLPFAITAAVFVIRHLVIRIKEKKTGLCVSELAALGIPVVLAVAASLGYNYARFGSLFDFGTAYQLTVADTSLYKISLSGLAPAVFHYFIQPFTVSDSFPYIAFNYINLGNYGSLTYVDSGLGIFAMPFMLMLFASPVLLKSKHICKGRKALLITALSSLVITAFFDFCMGGVIFRYTADISLYAAFLAAVIAMECGEIISEKFGMQANKVYSYCVTALGVLTAVISFGAALIPSGNFVDSSPMVFGAVRDFFEFWK